MVERKKEKELLFDELSLMLIVESFRTGQAKFLSLVLRNPCSIIYLGKEKYRLPKEQLRLFP
jgi:hypothetical protein